MLKDDSLSCFIHVLTPLEDPIEVEQTYCLRIVLSSSLKV